MLSDSELSCPFFSSVYFLPIGLVRHFKTNVQMLERMEQQQKEMEGSMQEQRQQLQADQDDLASWKADAHRQLDMQQVCLHAFLVRRKAHGTNHSTVALRIPAALATACWVVKQVWLLELVRDSATLQTKGAVLLSIQLQVQSRHTLDMLHLLYVAQLPSTTWRYAPPIPGGTSRYSKPAAAMQRLGW